MSEDLPRANVKRIVKAKMLDIAAARFRDERTSRDLPIHRDALTAFSDSAKIFIHYISATANDICRESKRQTLSADDVLRAVEEIEFVELIKPLRAALDGYRKVNASKKAEKKSNMRKRKLENTTESHEDENGEVDNVENEDEQEEGSGMEEDDESAE
ncbi:unnamed protein product [Calypogeia fissa]